MKTLPNLLGGKSVYLFITINTRRTSKNLEYISQNLTYHCNIIYVRILKGSFSTLFLSYTETSHYN